MSFLERLSGVFAAFGKYAAIAGPAVAQAEKEIGPGNGQSKRQLAVSYILAFAHAGESVSVPQVQAIASLVDLTVGIANSLGGLGKQPAPNATVAVPAAMTTPPA